MAKGKYQDWLTEDGLLLLEGWARNGLTDVQIAKNCGVSTTTLYNWKAKHVAIFEALKKGKEVVDLMVENALLKRALGYTYEEKTWESVTDLTGESEPVMKLVKVVTKEVVPDVTAQIYWLKNRKRDVWKNDHDKVELERERMDLDRERLAIEQERFEKEVEMKSEADGAKSIHVTFDDALKEFLP